MCTRGRQIGFVCGLGVGVLVAARPTAAQPRLGSFAQRAQAEAFDRLMVQLERLPLAEERTVAQWIGGRASFAVAFRRAAYAVAVPKVVSAPSDSICRVEVSVPIGELARAWALRLRAQGVAAVDELEALRQWSLRAGPQQLRAQAAVDKTASDRDYADAPGWTHLPAESVRQAGEAAIADARMQLLEQCRTLRLSARESLGDVFDAYVALEDAFVAVMGGRLAGQPVVEPCGLCTFATSLTRTDVIELLLLAVDRVQQTQALPRFDFSQLTDPAWREAIEVTGVSMAPPAWLAWPQRRWRAAPPTWAHETLTAVGKSTSAGGARGAAVASARHDAIRNMWSQVDELILPDGRRVRDVIGRDPLFDAALHDFEPWIRMEGEPETDPQGHMWVKVTMSMGPVWTLLAPVVEPGLGRRHPGPPRVNQPIGVTPATQPGSEREAP